MGAIKATINAKTGVRRFARGSLVGCLLSATLGLAACGGGDAEAEPSDDGAEAEPSPSPSPEPGSDEVTFEDVHPAFVRTCAGSDCHGAGTTMRPGPIADPDLETAREAAEDDKLLITAMIETGMMPNEQNCLSASGQFSTKRTCLSEEERMAVSLWATE